jgi:hypothetical protein
MLRIYVKSPPAPVEIVPDAPALELTFDDISNVPVADASSVSDWNTFFDLPVNGSPFTSVEVVGNLVKLIGGSGITLKNHLFFENINIVSIIDNSLCVIEIGVNAFTEAYLAIEFTFNAVIKIGGSAFANCISAIINLNSLEIAEYNSLSGIANTTLNFPNLQTCGDGCFAGNTINEINLPNVVSAGDGCFASINGLSNIILPLVTDIGDNCFLSDTSITNIYIPSCINLGTTTSLDDVFHTIIGQPITLTIPAALMTCNGGNPDGDIQYLQANNTVTIVTV